MRRRRPEKRTILPDTKYNDLSVAKFINYIMENGKKGVAEKIFYGAMDLIHKKTKTRENTKTAKFYRYINEVPTLLLILIVFIVIIKPL